MRIHLHRAILGLTLAWAIGCGSGSDGTAAAEVTTDVGSSDVAADTVTDLGPADTAPGEVQEDAALDVTVEDADDTLNDAPDAPPTPPECPGATPTTYTCPGGHVVPLCACEPSGYACDPHPEAKCPTLCGDGDAVAWPCSDGTSLPWCTCKVPSCAPVCNPAGKDGEGWYDACSKALVKLAKCALACTAVCTAIGSESEGWSDACTSELISWASCAPTIECQADPGAKCPSPMCYVTTGAQLTCPDGTTAPFCTCMSAAADCKPKCDKVGTKDEGWYGGCDGKLLQATPCAGCTSSCGAIGSKSEGWYSSCSGLIGWTQCATGIWTCKDKPWEACGTLAVPGSPCQGDGDCGAGLLCAKGGGTIGVCTRVCNPGAPDCGVGVVCVPLPGFEAPGFCLTPCAAKADCPVMLSCGSDPTMPAAAPACFPWPPCDPVKGVGCGPAEQCRVVSGAATCGEPGTLAQGAACKPAADACGPGLVCGVLDQCWPVCTDDAQCKVPNLDFCLKKPADAMFGHCMFLE